MSDANTSPETPAPEFIDANVPNDSPPDAPKKAPRAKKPLIIPSKVQKKLETLQSKIEKLSSDNKTLKSQLAHAKTSHTRIRRIPKVAAEEVTA